MCMADDAEMVNILSDVDRVARKEHRCGEYQSKQRSVDEM